MYRGRHIHTCSSTSYAMPRTLKEAISTEEANCLAVTKHRHWKKKQYTLPQKLLYNSAALPNTSGAEFVVQVLPLRLQTAFTTMAGGKKSSFIVQDATKNIRNSQQCLSNISEPTISFVIIRQLWSSVLMLKPSIFVLRKVCGVGGREKK